MRSTAVHQSEQRDDDEVFLDEALERILDAWNEGEDLPLDGLVSARPHLEERILGLARTARVTAVQHSKPRTVLAEYEIIEQLGRGGMGTVFLARQQRLGRLVALKVTPGYALASARSRERFRREARVLASLNHSNIVTIHDVVEADGVAAYAMEWIDGPTLADAPGKDAAASCRTAIAILRALSVVHEAGLVHRDVSSRNILLRPDGAPVLTDFGLVGDGSLSGATRSGEFIGTAAYASPEQLRGDHGAVGPAADQYAVGVLLFESLFGRHPFDGAESITVLLQRMESGIPPKPRRHERTFSRDVEIVIEKALAPRPNDRYEHVDALADDLERVLAFRPIVGRPPHPAKRAWQILRVHRKPLAAALTAALVVAVAAIWFVTDRARQAQIPFEVERAVRAARAELLDRDIGRRLYLSFVQSPEVIPPPQRRGLRRALRHYRRATALDPLDEGIAVEKTLVELAYDQLDEPSEAQRRVLRDYPLTLALVGGVEPPTSMEAASLEDRRALGLLAYLTGAPQLCIRAWSGLDLADSPDPFIDAAVGDLHLSMGRPELAYPRLLSASRRFPDSGHLAISAADAACQVGDLAVAERLVKRTKRLGLENRYAMLECVEADLLVAHGEPARAAAAYARIRILPPSGSLKFASVLRSLGESRRALDQEMKLLNSFPNSNELRERVAHQAAAWWSTLTDDQKLQEIEEALSHPQRSLIEKALEVSAHGSLSEVSPDSATPLVPDSTQDDGPRPVAGLDLTREILSMNRKTGLLLAPFARRLAAKLLLAVGSARTGSFLQRVASATITLAVTLGSLSLPVPGQSQITVTDGDFANWVFTPYLWNHQTLGASASTGSMTPTTQGNPGNALEATNSVTTNGAAWVVAIKDDFTWDPATQGAIVDVQLSIDTVTTIIGAPAGQGIRLAIEQGGIHYHTSVGVTSTLQTWHTIVSPTPSAAYGMLPFAVPGSPDFTANGAPLKFGFIAHNATCVDCAGYSTAQRYDNWQLVVHHSPPAPLQYPGSGEDFLLASGLNGATCTTGLGEDLKTANGGDLLTVCLDSPNLTFAGGLVYLIAGVSAAGSPLTQPFPIPLNDLWVFPYVVLVDGLSSSPLGLQPVLVPGGLSYGFYLPAPLVGQQVAFQCGVIHPAAVNSVFAVTEAHVITIQ